MSFTSSPTATRWSDVYFIVGSRLFTAIGTTATATALLLTLQTSGAGGLAAGALVVVTTLPQVVLAPVTGRVADRVDSRVLIVVAGLGECVLSLVLAHTTQLYALLGMVFALSSCGALLQPTYGGLVPSIVTKRDLSKSSALSQTAASIGLLIGPALAGVLVGGFGTRTALYVNAITALATVCAGLAIRTRRSRRRRTDTDSGPGTWRLSQDRLLLTTVTALAIVVAAVTSINVAEVFFVRETLGASEATFGLIVGCWPAGMMLGGWLFARPIRDAAHDGKLAQWMMLSFAVMSGIIVVAGYVHGSAWWLAPLFIAGGVLNGAQNSTMSVLIAHRAPEANRSRAIATLQAFLQTGSLTGMALGGVLLELMPARAVVLLAGSAGVTATLAVVPFVRRPVREAALAVKAA